MKQPWRIQMFGELKAERLGRVVTHFETRKTAALLACLALHPGRLFLRETLAEQLWPDEDWEATHHRLRQAISALRRALDADDPDSSLFAGGRNELGIDESAVVTDTAEFELSVEAA